MSDSCFDEALLVGLRVDPGYSEPVLHQVPRIAIYDEYHAFETYNQVIAKFGPINPFVNIREAEVRHYSALTPLLEKYRVPLPINNWASRIQVPDTLVECCEVGVAAEIDNVRMYDNLLGYVAEPDVRDLLVRLRAASHDNHLPAFRTCVARYYGDAGIERIYRSYSTHPVVRSDGPIARPRDRCDLEGASADVSAVWGRDPSFIGGLLLGGLGIALLSRILKGR